MNSLAKLTITAAALFAVSTSTASAFNSFSPFGGMAKYHAHNAAKAHGNLTVKALTFGKGSVRSSSISEQVNNTYKTVRPGRTTIGGTSASINTLNAKWNNLHGFVGVNTGSSASGQSGLSGMKGRIRFRSPR